MYVSEALEVAPSLGFFGDGKGIGLNLKVHKPVKSLRIKLVGGGDGVLNLKHLLVYGEDSKVIAAGSVEKVSCSSAWVGKNPRDLLFGKGFHSKVEVGAWWKVDFIESIFLSEIEIKNRGDVWGSRSQFICIEAQCSDGDWLSLYDIKNDSYLCGFYKKADELLGVDIQNYLLAKGKELRRDVVIPAILKVFQRGRAEDKDLLFFAQFLPIWDSRLSVSDEDIELLAYIVFASTKKSINLPLKQFSVLLYSSGKIKYFLAKLNQLRRKHGFSELMLTKHGLAKKGKLIEDKKNTISSLKKVMNNLEVMGYSPMLAYGTLLGAYRDAGFMEHDDDVDILIKCKSNNRDEVLSEIEEVSKKFSSMGYKIGAKNKHLNRHFVDRETGVAIDVFPCWVESGECQLHMEKMHIRGVAPSIFWRRESVDLYGEKFPAPGKVEDFLVERYGSSWDIPDIYHEWPWKLEEDR